MPEFIPDNIIEEIDYAVVLSEFVYKDDQSGNYQNKTFSEMLPKEKSDGVTITPGSLMRDTELAEMLKQMGNFKLIAQSSFTECEETGENHTMETLIACAFKDTVTGEVYIIYRGTGDGKWVDNGVAMGEVSSLMQERATQFCNKVIEEQEIKEPGKIIIAGHSKGGNLAQYVTMTADKKYLIKNCYSFDGQGFSGEAIKMFHENMNEEEYNAQINKMYSINGQNDYVHDLGTPIIRGDRTYFVETEGQGFGEFHSQRNMMRFGGINWKINPDGTYNFDVPQGPVGKLAKELSEKMMQLPKEERYDCAVSIMSFLELVMKNDKTGENSKVGTGDVEWANLFDILGFAKNGTPIIINTLINSEYTIESIKLLGANDDILVIVEELRAYALEKGIDDFAGYIAEDPLRLIEIYSSLDLSKPIIHKAVSSFLTTENIAKILVGVVGVAGVSAIAHVITPRLALIADFAVAVTVIRLIANHIYQNWDEIMMKIKDTVNDIKIYVSEKFNELVEVVKSQFKRTLEAAVDLAKKAITNGKQIINSAVTAAVTFLDKIRDKAVDAIKKSFEFTKNCLYRVAEGVYRVYSHIVKLDVTVLSDCVDRMMKLATRVSAIDERLDALYLALIKDDIEENKGVFTSIANLYNLTSADIKVDQASLIVRRARQLSEMYQGYVDADNWVKANLPGCN